MSIKLAPVYLLTLISFFFTSNSFADYYLSDCSKKEFQFSDLKELNRDELNKTYSLCEGQIAIDRSFRDKTYNEANNTDNRELKSFYLKETMEITKGIIVAEENKNKIKKILCDKHKVKSDSICKQ